MPEIADLIKKINKFRDVRDWKQFHNPKDEAISLVLEASEVMEHFQWKNNHEIEKYIKLHKREIGEELADVLNYLLLLSHDLGIDLVKAFNKKLIQNNKKYPINKSKGTAKKYNLL